MSLSALVEELKQFAAPVPPPPPPAAAPAATDPAAPATPPPTPAPAPACGEVSYAARGYHADFTVSPATVVAAAKVLLRREFLIEAVTGVDWLADGQFEVIYDFFSISEGCRVVLRLRVPRDEPKVPTLSEVFSGAEWHERETHDFFGIEFTGLKSHEPFILPEDATFHPLRKDYAP